MADSYDEERRGDPIWRYLVLVALFAVLASAVRTPHYFERFHDAPRRIYYALKEELIDRPARREREQWEAEEEEKRFDRWKATQTAAGRGSR